MKRLPKIGALRVSPYDDYEPGAAGFVVEEYGFNSYPNDPPGWRIPAWDERGAGDKGRVYPSRKAAERALSGMAQ